MARRRLSFVVSMKDDASHALQRVNKEVDGLTLALRRLGGITAGLFSAREIVQAADQYRLLTNRIRLVTESTAELNTIQKELLDLSRDSRSSFQSTADLYARVARSSRRLGLSQQDLLDLTETINKSIRISGSTSQEAAAGVIQFGQALASSRLSGDELRSVLEQMPRLAQAIAEGLDTDIGKLREMGQAGELTADQVIGALQRVAPEIGAEFEQLEPLVSEAFTVLRGSVMAAVGELDEFVGVSRQVAEVLLDLNGQLLSLVDLFVDVTDETQELTTVTKVLGTTFIVVFTTLKVLGRSLLDTISFVTRNVLGMLQNMSERLSALFSGDQALSDQLGEEFKKRFEDDLFATFGDGGLFDKVKDDIAAGYDGILRIINETPLEFDTPVDLAKENVVEAFEEMEEAVDHWAKFSERAAQRAAENIMDAFADFLFDPFEDGVRGMLRGFLDAIRRMLANMLAFQILTNIPGLGTFFENTKGRVAGGPVTAGQPVLVGERGPELFIPNASGAIRNNSATKAGAMGEGMQFITNIDARGADPGLIARLPAIMEQRDKQLMLKVVRLLDTGGVTL